MSIQRRMSGRLGRRIPAAVLLAALLGLTMLGYPMPATGLDTKGQGLEDPGVADEDPLDLDALRAKVKGLENAKREIQGIFAAADTTLGESFQLARMHGLEVETTILALTDDLIEALPGIEESASVRDTILNAVEASLRFQGRMSRTVVGFYGERLVALEGAREKASLEELGDLEVEIGEIEQLLNNNLARMLRVGRAMEDLGFDASALWTWVDEALAARAEQLDDQLMVATLVRGRLKEQIETSKDLGIAPGEEELRRFHAEQIRVDETVSSLSTIADLMDARGLDSSSYRLLVIRTTGEVTEDILNWKVLAGLIREAVIDILRWLRRGAPDLLVRFGVVLLFALLFRLIGRLFWYTASLFLRPPKLLDDLLRRLVRPVSTIIGILLGLWFLGVNPTTLLASVGVLSLILGLALQDSLGNLAAGLFILIYRPYDVDEIVQAGGVLGRVREMGLANTTIITFDNRRFFIPNRKIWGDIIENRSLEKVRRVHATINISYDDDIVKVLKGIDETLRENDLVLKSPPPEIFVSKLSDSWLEVSVWPWTKSASWWELESQLPLILRVGLEARGVSVPYPRRKIDMISEGQPDGESGNQG